MKIKIMVQEAHKLLYFVRYTRFHRRRHKIVAYVHSWCSNRLTFFKWEFEQKNYRAKEFYRIFEEWKLLCDDNTNKS